MRGGSNRLDVGAQFIARLSDENHRAINCAPTSNAPKLRRGLMNFELISPAPWRVCAVNALPNYCLSLTCHDGTSGIIDMAALVHSADAGIFAALKDAPFFQQVCIEQGALTWSNGADLDPAWVHEALTEHTRWVVPS